MSRVKIVISVFVVLVGALHVVPILQEMRRSAQTTWPIMAWGMFRTSSGPPVTTTDWTVVAVREGGTRTGVSARDVGLGKAAYGKVYIRPLLAGDSAAAREMTRILSETGATVTRLELQGTTYEIVDGDLRIRRESGPVYASGERR